MKKYLYSLFLFLGSPTLVAASTGIRPPIADPNITIDCAESGACFSYTLLHFWNAFTVIGSLAVVLYFVWGAFSWITSGGDKTKLETARNRMIHAALGFVIFVSAYAIIGFIGQLIGYDLLNPGFFTPI